MASDTPKGCVVNQGYREPSVISVCWPSDSIDLCVSQFTCWIGQKPQANPAHAEQQLLIRHGNAVAVFRDVPRQDG